MTNNDEGDPGASLGDVLRHARTDARLSVRELSERSGISIGQVSKLENDHVKKINPAHLAALAGPLGLPISDLYGAAGYTVSELADHEADLIDKLKSLSPEAFQSVVDLIEDYLDRGAGHTAPALATVESDDSSTPNNNE